MVDFVDLNYKKSWLFIIMFYVRRNKNGIVLYFDICFWGIVIVFIS